MVTSSRKPWKFFFQYAQAYRGEHGGIIADGCSERAETELVRRLKLLSIKHDRSVVWKDCAPKTRQVIRLDVGGKDESSSLAKDLNETHLWRALESTLELKVDSICENVIDGLGAGEKCVIWCLTRSGVEILAEAIEKAIEANDVRTLMRQQKVHVWATHGEANIDVRFQIAAKVRRHPGACALIATMDSMPESISIGPEIERIGSKEIIHQGVTTEHYAQLHYLPGPMVQSENRPYLKNTSKLHIIYYIAKGTVDERMERKVLPRVEIMAKLSEEKDAVGIQAALRRMKESPEDMLKRLFSSMPDSDGRADFNYGDMPDEED